MAPYEAAGTFPPPPLQPTTMDRWTRLRHLLNLLNQGPVPGVRGNEAELEINERNHRLSADVIRSATASWLPRTKASGRVDGSVNHGPEGARVGGRFRGWLLLSTPPPLMSTQGYRPPWARRRRNRKRTPKWTSRVRDRGVQRSPKGGARTSRTRASAAELRRAPCAPHKTAARRRCA